MPGMRALRRWLIAGAAAGVISLPVPGRSAPFTFTGFGGKQYVSMVEACGRLDLRFTISANGRTMTVANRAHRGLLLPPGEINNREMDVDGVRVWLGDPAYERGGQFYVSRTDYEKRLLPLFRPDLVLPPPPHGRTIVIDAGHGGPDPGAQNHRLHVEEKTFTLDVALRLQRILSARGWRVLMTRTRDVALGSKDVDLVGRAVLANQNNAELFLSIHFDSAGDSRLHGCEVITFAPVGQRSTDAWGERTDDAERVASPGNRYDGWNTVLAHAVFRRLQADLKGDDHGERIRRRLAVLRHLEVPGVLVEPAFISNEGDVQRLMSPQFRQRLAESLAEGIGAYAGEVDALYPRASAGPAPKPPVSTGFVTPTRP
jgi:N-acetylmuramoyl-L-alanine amidase